MCSAGPTQLLACDASIAELPRLKAFISLNLYLFWANTALLHNCVFFRSFNSPSRFLFGSFVEGSSKDFIFF